MCLLDAPMIESVHVYMAAESIIYTSQMHKHILIFLFFGGYFSWKYMLSKTTLHSFLQVRLLNWRWLISWNKVSFLINYNFFGMSCFQKMLNSLQNLGSADWYKSLFYNF
jgi:hypothetical protein